MNIHTPDIRIGWDLEALDQLVELYRDFFNKVGGTLRVQEIDQMYSKKLCPKVTLHL
jgi:hypothetical protein